MSGLRRFFAFQFFNCFMDIRCIGFTLQNFLQYYNTCQQKIKRLFEDW